MAREKLAHSFRSIRFILDSRQSIIEQIEIRHGSNDVAEIFPQTADSPALAATVLVLALGKALLTGKSERRRVLKGASGSAAATLHHLAYSNQKFESRQYIADMFSRTGLKYQLFFRHIFDPVKRNRGGSTIYLIHYCSDYLDPGIVTIESRTDGGLEEITRENDLIGVANNILSSQSEWTTDAVISILDYGRMSNVEAIERQFLNPIPKAPMFTNRGFELRIMEDAICSDNGNRPVILVGDSGMGKTYLMAHFIRTRLPRSDRESVFWHPFRRTASTQHLIERLDSYLEIHNLSDEREALRVSVSDPIRIFQFLNSLSARHIFVFDRLEDLNEGSIARQLMVLILSEESGNHPRYILAARDGVSYWTNIARGEVITLKHFNESSSRDYIRTIWEHATGDEPDDSVVESVYRTGGRGDPIRTNLATSLAIQLANSDRIMGVQADIDISRLRPQEELVRQIWKGLSRSSRLFLATASCAIPNRSITQIVAVYESLAERVPLRDSKSYDCVLDELSALANPFFREIAQYNVCHLTSFVRSILQRDLELPEAGVSIGEFLDLEWLRQIHREFGVYFEEMATAYRSDRKAVGQIPELVQKAYYHYARTRNYQQCLSLIQRFRQDFFDVDSLRVLLALTQDLEQHGRLFDWKQGFELLLTILKILRRLTLHGEARDRCVEWLDLVPERRALEKASIHFHLAVSEQVFCNYTSVEENLQCAMDTWRPLKSDDENSLKMYIKADIRLCILYMTMGRYAECFRRLRLLCDDVPPGHTHSWAMLARHVHTLSFLLGMRGSARFWAERCQSLNERIKDFEGVVIAKYKRARCVWLSVRLTKGLLAEALLETGDAIGVLCLKARGNRWWQIALLEQKGHILLNLYQVVAEKQVLLQEAREACAEARRLVNELEDAAEGNVMMMRTLEVKYLEARIASVTGASSAEGRFIELLKDLYVLGEGNDGAGAPFFEMIVRLDYAYFQAKSHKFSMAFANCNKALGICAEYNMMGMYYLPARTLSKICLNFLHANGSAVRGSRLSENDLKAFSGLIIGSHLMKYFGESDAALYDFESVSDLSFLLEGRFRRGIERLRRLPSDDVQRVSCIAVDLYSEARLGWLAVDLAIRLNGENLISMSNLRAIQDRFRNSDESYRSEVSEEEFFSFLESFESSWRVNVGSEV